MSKEIVKRVKSSDIELKDKLVAINRVTKVTKGGRHFSFSAIVVVGNEKGVIGQGLGKANEVTDAITKGIEDAKKNLIKVPVMKGTIPHDQYAKEGASKVLIKPAAHGTGVIAGGSMRSVLESVGITDVLAKSLGSANPQNVVKATFKALAMLREPIQISKTRTIGLKRVFNG
jgi:small subunit ribosomal protein S5